MKSKYYTVGSAILASWLNINCVWGGTPGSLDLTFVPATRSSDVLWALAIQPDGKILTGGRQNVTAPIYGVIYRLEANGQLDPSFQSGPRATGLEGAIPQINTIGIQVNGNIVLGGQFTYFDDPVRGRLAQLTASGELDPNFTPSANNHVFAMALQPDGKILIGGSFKNFKGTGQNYVARLNADGTRDDTFNSGAGPDNPVRALARQPDGKILIGGDFLTVDASSRPYLARLNPNGSLDATFSSAASLDASVSVIAVQPADQKIILGGSFSTAAGEDHSRIARLNADGTVDASFTNSCDSTVWALAVQHNGKILAGGRFNSVNGTARKKIVRFLPAGSLDPEFDAEAGAGMGSNDEVRAIQIQPVDGAIVVAGKFTVFNGQNRYGIARLYGDPPATGCTPCQILQQPQSLAVNTGKEASFSVHAEGTATLHYQWQKGSVNLNGETNALLVIPNVQSYHAGLYRVVVTNACGISTSQAATLTVDPIRITSSDVVQSNNHFAFTLQSQKTVSVEIQASMDLITWVSLTNRSITVGNNSFSFGMATNSNRCFYRAFLKP